MPHPNFLARGLLTCSLLIGLLIELILPSLNRVQAAPQEQAATNVVISQVYGGGGNSNATFQNDFVELFNPTENPVPLDNWSIQYASGNGNFSSVASLPNYPLASGQYYLVQIGPTGSNGSPLPTPDYTPPTMTNMNATDGKVILANITTDLACNGNTVPCDANTIVDLVGYGNADYYEGTTGAAPAPSAVKADFRKVDGCVDTNNNSADFLTKAPLPRNTTSATTDCNNIFTATAAFNQTGTASAMNQTDTAIANLTSTAYANQTATSAALTTTPTQTFTPTPGRFSVIINEINWGGTTNSSNDQWIELYNPGSFDINLNNWTLEAQSGNLKIRLTGVIKAGGYYLLAHVSATGTPSGCTVFNSNDVVVDQTFTGLLSKSGEVLELKDSSGGDIDSANNFVHSGSGIPWPAGTDSSKSPAFSSMERKANTLDSASSWITYGGATTNTPRNCKGVRVRGSPRAANWVWTVTLTPTPRPPTKVPTKLPTPVPRLVINEFLPRAGFDWNQDGLVNTFDEFIEIGNDSGLIVNLSGWRLQVISGDTKSYSLPKLTLKPGDHALFYGNQTNLLLSDGGGTIRLIDPRGVIMDAQTYGVVLNPDQAWCRLPDTRGSWYPDCSPTPNRINSRTGTIPSLPPGSGLESPVCLLPDTLPAEFRQAECFGYGANMWQAGYWDREAGQGDRFVPQNESKWETFIE